MTSGSIAGSFARRLRLLVRSHGAARLRGLRFASMPTAMVTGTNGKTTTCRLLASILKADGHTVGLATTDSVMVGDEVLRMGDLTGPIGHSLALSDKRTTAAVLETARGGLRKNGLYLRPAQACALLNVGADHIGMDGIDSIDAMADLKRRVTDAARRRVVLNADDSRTLALAGRYGARKVTLFSLDPANPALAGHLAAGGDVITADENAMIVHRTAQARPAELVAIADIPVTMGGKAEPFIANAMAAAGLAIALNVSTDAIGDGLTGFAGGPEANPCRFNVFQRAPVFIVGDQTINPHAFVALVETIDTLPIAGRRIICTSSAGNRSPEHYAETGRVLARGFDEFITFDIPRFRRGRVPGEIAALLEDGLLAAGVARDRVRAVPLLDDALALAAGMVRPGDFVLVTLDGSDDRSAIEAAFSAVNGPSTANGGVA